jgi:hypothetical protein
VPLGARVTVYSNAFSPIIEDIALFSKSIDRVLTGQTYNGGLNGQVGWHDWLACELRQATCVRCEPRQRGACDAGIIATRDLELLEQLYRSAVQPRCG